MQYIKLSVNTSHGFSEIVANALFELGSLGVEIVDPQDIKNLIDTKKHWDYIDESLLRPSSDVVVIGFFDILADITCVIDNIKALNRREIIGITHTIKNASDYENEWKKYYKPIEIKNVVIVPKWLKEDKPTIDLVGDKLAVYLDPGAAFGTGSHETTSMCILLLQDVEIKDNSVIDMGSGSGILGITALKLGAKHCAFIDIDPIAVQASKDNAALNDVEAQGSFTVGGFDGATSSSGGHSRPPYHTLIANLTADLLNGLYPHVKNLAKKGASIVLSGILSDRLQEIADLYSSSCCIIAKETKGDWGALLLKHS